MPSGRTLKCGRSVVRHTGGTSSYFLMLAELIFGSGCRKAFEEMNNPPSDMETDDTVMGNAVKEDPVEPDAEFVSPQVMDDESMGPTQ